MGSVCQYGPIIITVLTMCICLTATLTGVAVIHRQNKFGLVITNVYHTVKLNTLLTGILLALRGCLGGIGAITQNPCMLMTYAVVAGLILVMLLITAIVLLVFSNNATHFLSESMTDVYKQYGEEGKEELTHHLDDLQHEGQCCGISGYEDWENFPYDNGTSVADGCCKKWTEGCGVGMLNNPNVTGLVWSDGCLDYVYAVFAFICFNLAILSFILVGYQTLSIACACICTTAAGGYIQI